MWDDGERQAFEDARAAGRRQAQREATQPRVFTEVKDRDLVTLMDRFAVSSDFHAMLVAAQLIAEVDRRQLWDAVVERRAETLARTEPDEDATTLRDRARSSLDAFRDEHFPVDPDVEDLAGA